MLFNWKFFTILISFDVFTILILNVFGIESLRLRQLHVVFRHGDRQIDDYSNKFPNDPNMKGPFDPPGSGQLTSEGKVMMFELGKYLRHKYNDFLGTKYYEDEVYGVSLDIERTQLSLLLVLAGLYPDEFPVDEENCQVNNFNVSLLSSIQENNYIFGRKTCKHYVERLIEILKSDEIQNKLLEYRPFIKNLTNLVGMKTSMILFDLKNFHKNLYQEKNKNMTLEPWMIDVINNGTLNEIRLFNDLIFNYDNILVKSKMGPMIKTISDYMIHEIYGIGNIKKLFLYSGKGNNIISLLYAYGLYKEPHFPKSSSALIFELLSDKVNDYVKVSYYKGTPDNVEVVAIPGCDALCPFNKFYNLTSNVRPSNEEIMSCEVVPFDYYKEAVKNLTSFPMSNSSSNSNYLIFVDKKILFIFLAIFYFLI